MNLYSQYVGGSWTVIQTLAVPIAFVVGIALFGWVGGMIGDAFGLGGGGTVPEGAVSGYTGRKMARGKNGRPGRNSGSTVMYGKKARAQEPFINATASAKASGMSEENWLRAHAAQSGQMNDRMLGPAPGGD